MQKKGFTLIEILVVLMVISVVSLLAIFGGGRARTNAKDDKRRADLSEISGAIERYRSDCGHYPQVAEYVTAASSGTLVGTGETPACASTNVYKTDFPKDPDNNSGSHVYSYNEGPNLQSVIICASLENSPVPPIDVSDCSLPCSLTDPTNIKCNYLIRNP